MMAGSRFGVLALGGLGGMMSAGIGGSNLNLMNDGLASAQLGVNGFGALASLGGGGMGSWNPLAMPGRINNTNPIYEYAHQAQVAGVMMDPSLSVEDKVTLMLMLIMKKMDRDIARQAQYINSIQQQQSKNHGKGKAVGGPGGLLGLPLGGALGSKLGGATVGKLGGAAILKPNSIGKEIKKSFKGKTIKNRFKKVKKSLKGKNIKKKLRKKRNRLKKNPLKAIATGTGLVGGGALGGVLGGALGGALGGVPGKLGGLPSAAPSIDVETMKLKRMIDKRGQMFDMLRQIIDKYNETAKGLIQSMGR
jgi:hypothetical protein